MANHMRRTLIMGAASALPVTLAAGVGLLIPVRVLAADGNRAAFEVKVMAEALKSIGAASPAGSKDIVIKVPEIAENGAVLPVEVLSNIAGTESIHLLVEKNPFPLNSTFRFSNGAESYVSTRIKMGQTSMLHVVVKAGDKYYTAAREVKVTIGGCGG